MRIICPSCLAEYEVQDTAIPQSGRDVQCSNCGHAWFQPGPALAPSEDPDEGNGAEPEADQTEQEAVAPREPGRGGAALAAREEPGSHEPAEDPDDDEDDDPPATDLPPRRIDEAVLRVLREEAERESRARRAEAGVIETQQDLGLEHTPPRRPERPKRQIIGDPAVATPRPPKRERSSGRDRRPEPELPGETREEAAHPVATPASGRSRLPDIEDVSPTLSGSSGAEGPDEYDVGEVRQRGRFRTGFLGVLMVAALALLLYALTPQIVALVPATEPVLSAYSETMDRARLWVSEAVDAALRAILAQLT